MEILELLLALTPGLLLAALLAVLPDEERVYWDNFEPTIPEGYLLADGREVPYPVFWEKEPIPMKRVAGEPITFPADFPDHTTTNNKNQTLYLYRDDVMTDEAISKIQDAIPSGTGIKVEIVYN